MGHEGERAAAQIQLRALTHQHRGRHHRGAVGERAQGRAQVVQVIVAAHGERDRQLGVPDECGAVGHECGVAEQVVGMHVARDHEADRPCCDLPDGRVQASAGARAAAGVDHRDRLVPEHEPDVRDVGEILRRRELVHATMHEDAGRDLGHAKWCRGRGPGRRQSGRDQKTA